MMLLTTLVSLATSLIAVLAAPLEKRAVADILFDIALINTDITNIESDLNGLSSSGPDGYDALGVQATAASSATGPLSESDAGNVAQHVGVSANGLIKVLDLYVENKPILEEFTTGIPNLISTVEENIQDLGSAVTDFTTDLVKNAPADIDAADGPIRTAVTAAFANAIAAFQS